MPYSKNGIFLDSLYICRHLSVLIVRKMKGDARKIWRRFVPVAYVPDFRPVQIEATHSCSLQSVALQSVYIAPRIYWSNLVLNHSCCTALSKTSCRCVRDGYFEPILPHSQALTWAMSLRKISWSSEIWLLLQIDFSIAAVLISQSIANSSQS